MVKLQQILAKTRGIQLYFRLKVKIEIIVTMNISFLYDIKMIGCTALSFWQHA